MIGFGKYMWIHIKIKSLLFGMGESHQVLIQYKGKKDIQSLKGFEFRNSVNVL
jgi:hypothetical protein